MGEPLVLPPPGAEFLKRDRKFMIHLTPDGDSRLRQLAKVRNQPPGRLASVIVERGVAQLFMDMLQDKRDGNEEGAA